MEAPKFVTREEAATEGRCSREAVDKAIRTGLLDAIKPSPRRILIPADAVTRWLSSRPSAARPK